MKTPITSAQLSYTADLRPTLTIVLQCDRKAAQQGIQAVTDALAKGKAMELEIRPKKRRRSLDANAYCWVICQKIAETIGSTKELVYREFIKRVGQFEILPIKDEAVDRWIEVWGSKGVGWIAEVLDDSKLQGYKKVISYYGSSVYSVDEMRVLLDEIVRECHALGLETDDPAQIESLLKTWEGK